MIDRVLTYEESHKEIDGVLHKLCKICEEWFPCNTEYFYKHDSSKKTELVLIVKLVKNIETTNG